MFETINSKSQPQLPGAKMLIRWCVNPSSGTTGIFQENSSQYLACQCPSSLNYQDISNHGTECTGKKRLLSTTKKGFHYLCHLSVEKWYKYIFVSKNKFSEQALIDIETCPLNSCASHLGLSRSTIVCGLGYRGSGNSCINTGTLEGFSTMKSRTWKNRVELLYNMVNSLQILTIDIP